MNCALLDLPCHLHGLLFGWIAFVPWWAWAVVAAIVIGIVWKMAGWPGLIGLAAAAGFIFGRRTSSKEDDIFPDPDKRPSAYRRSSQKAPPGKRVRTIFDVFKQR